MSYLGKLGLGPLLYIVTTGLLGLYFTYAAVRGDYGIFRRAEVEAQERQLGAELDALDAQVARMENLTHRLSDEFLDVDLLDERARDVLGLIRPDEILIR